MKKVYLMKTGKGLYIILALFNMKNKAKKAYIWLI